MDCGEGAQNSFVRFGLGLNKEMLILITHLHGDHVNGLLGMLQTMSMSQRIRSLTIVAPSPLYVWLKTTMDLLHVGLTFELRFVPVKPGVVFRSREYRIRATRAAHSIEAWAYLFEELPRPGIFDALKAKELAVPEGKKWNMLQHGKKVVHEGRTIHPREVVGPQRPGRKIGYSGDTRPTAALARFFRGADLLIFDSTFSAKDADKAKERKHSTSVEAAKIAQEAAVRKLLLTHFSARYRSVSGLVREARRIFPVTFAAHDGLFVEVPNRQ
jgi:ribonuclease Z